MQARERSTAFEEVVGLSRRLGLLLALLLVACQPAPQPTASATAVTTPTLTQVPSATPTQTPAPTPTPTPTGAPHAIGGSLYLLMSTAVANGGTGFYDMDPQRIYTGEDLAFFGATIMRTLTSFASSPDRIAGTALVPDAATDTGTPSDGGRTWSFTLRGGLTWQDGSPVKCADFAYGVSRTFATDVITDGPTYAIAYLDIPTNSDGSSKYPGPYTATASEQAMFDRAVVCDGNTITFHLNRPVADFNYTVTLGFAAVPNPIDHPGVDDGEKYDQHPWSDGPYVIDSLTTGLGGGLILKRNPNWSAASDPYRPAYPDEWDVEFGIDPSVLDQRLMNPTGTDQFALAYSNSQNSGDGVQADDLSTIFADSHTANPEFAGRAFSDYDPYARYYWIRTDKVTNPLVRKAMAVALDRDAIRATNPLGEFSGDFADGVLKPNSGMDYAPTHLWDASGPFGKDIPTTGDPALARQLILESGEAPPTLTWDYVAAPISNPVAGIVQSSLQRAGFTVKLNPIPSYPCWICNPAVYHEIGSAGWGPDWPDASTVIPPLFTPDGGFDISLVSSDNYPAFESAVADALTTMDRQQQALKWQALDQQASDQAFVIPTFWGLQQTIAGNHVGNLYRRPAYGGTWPYARLYPTF